MPTRYLKSGIRDSEAIEKLSPLAENLYYRLLVTVDDFGRYDARPPMIKAACFPVKDSITASKAEVLMKELVENGLIDIYVVDNKPYLQMNKWDNIPRAKESKFPANTYDAIQLHTTVCDSNTDAPLTVTETETKTVTKTTTPPEGVSLEVWEEFKSLRIRKRSPITQRVVDNLKAEADKAGWTLEKALNECCVRGWQAFKADWVAQRTNPADIARVTVPPSNLPDPALEKIKEDEKRAAPIPLEVLAKMAALRAKA
jgi:hypothetical protein